MKPKTESKTYWVLRIFCPGMDGDYYAYDCKGWGQKASWALTTAFSRAKHFHNRSDARRVVKSKAVQKQISGDWGNWFWEVAKITETVSTTYEAEVVCGDAPAMVQIARSV